MSLTGAAGNDDQGVWCEIQGFEHDLDRFESLATAEAPPLARVSSVYSVDVPVIEAERGFTIAASAPGAGTVTGTVPPDVATCSACLAEMADPGDRRHRYAFTCCTDCGPRYTVVQSLPYDRERTSMAAFTLCDSCEAEYRDPADRRHHAQAVCCPDCGPTLTLDPAREEVFAARSCVSTNAALAAEVTPTTDRATATDSAEAATDPPPDEDAEPAQADQRAGDPIEQAAALLRAGRIVAVKGAGGYQLACRADDSAAVARLRRRKHREEKPFALLVGSVEAAGELVVLDDLAVRALSGPEAPIVLAPRRESAPVAPEVAPDSRLLGVMLPATPLHALLAEAAAVTLVCTSGNRSDEPTVIDDARVADGLGDIADSVLGHDRVIERRADDSVGHVAAGRFQLLRRARGYAPGTVRLSEDGPVVLAVGAELKSTVCLAVGADAHLSVHLGDLEHPAALSAFEAAVADLLELTRAAPELVIHDLHPEYLSTKFAASVDLAPRLGVQHHHAHLASCLADAGFRGPAIGVMFDGLGWGADGTLWGGEVLVGDASGCERIACLRPVPMPGGTAAIREPWRMALAHLDAVFGEDLPSLPFLADRDEETSQVLEQCRPGRSITTTSMGRLFDAVAALCGFRGAATYEGQAAVRLEQMAVPASRRYPVELSDGACALIETAPLLDAVVADLRVGVDPAEVAGAFHRWVADAVLAASRHARDRTGLGTVALSGGVFQNRLLVELAVPLLDQAGFQVLLHSQVPPNDGGIALGQAAIGRATLADRPQR